MSRSIEDIVELVRRVKRQPNDLEARQVLADWCEEEGLLHVRGSEGITRVVPMPIVSLGPMTSEINYSLCFVKPFRFRKLLIGSDLAYLIHVMDIVVTDDDHNPIRSLFDKPVDEEVLSPVPASLFTEVALMTFDSFVEAGRCVAVHLTNVSNGDVYLSSALLGS